ncbi:MAG: chromosomal replication initiator protein DnaA [Clostridia bacterium]|nr:chromosomal replication initiator protein DnaA [Clostridia bacterium]
MDNINFYWEKARMLLKENLTGVSFDTWIKPLEPVSYNDGIFTLATETDFLKNMISSRYSSVISACLSTVIEEAVSVNVILSSEKGIEKEIKIPVFNKNAIGLNPKYTFDNFIVGSSNKFAHAASVAVAETPAKAYNPLFLYGSSGLGKTHLLHAIGNYISVLNPSLKVLYIPSVDFTNELINSIQKGTNESFRNKYRQIDVLLIDDIQFIAGKTSTQEEFFHTFNHLHQADKQIIISSDQPPKKLNNIEERLITRFEWGIVCDIQSPDYETRFAILQQKLQGTHAEIPADVLDYIASSVDTNIRELEGALNRVSALSSLSKTTINLDTAKNILGEYKNQAQKIYTVDEIKSYVSDYFGITVEDLMSKKKTKEISYARQLAMYICRNLLDLSTPKVGSSFNRDHTTVLHAVDKIGKSIKIDKAVESDYSDIVSNIKNG